MISPLRRSLPFPVAISLLVLQAAAIAQGMPGPAAEVQKLAPLIGNWEGTGEATFGPGAPPTKWSARGTYRWALGGHFVREDFELSFEGMGPMLFRSYMGWDAEGQRYVNAMASNGGEARLHTMTLLPDGTMLQVMLQVQEGVPYAERSLFQVDGDKLKHAVDLLMMAGRSTTVVDGFFTRGGKGFDGAMDAGAFLDKPPAALVARLARGKGSYAVDGEVVMAPGQPALKLHGTDVLHSVWGGGVVIVESTGGAEGMPGQYESIVLWGHDELRRCLVGVYVSSTGQVGAMDGRYLDDGKLIATSTGTMRGAPSVGRMVMEFDANGASTKAIGHSLLGASEPFVSFRATYAKK